MYFKYGCLVVLISLSVFTCLNHTILKCSGTTFGMGSYTKNLLLINELTDQPQLNCIINVLHTCITNTLIRKQIRSDLLDRNTPILQIRFITDIESNSFFLTNYTLVHISAPFLKYVTNV